MDINALLKQARDERGQTVVQRHVDLVKAIGEHRKLGGEEDYKASLSAIVAEFETEGVMYSLVREVLHDTEKLNAAVESLVDAKEITKGNGKRDFLMKMTKPVVDQPKSEPSPSHPTEEKATDGPDDVPPAAEQSVKPLK